MAYSSFTCPGITSQRTNRFVSKALTRSYRSVGFLTPTTLQYNENLRAAYATFYDVNNIYILGGMILVTLGNPETVKHLVRFNFASAKIIILNSFQRRH